MRLFRSMHIWLYKANYSRKCIMESGPRKGTRRVRAKSKIGGSQMRAKGNKDGLTAMAVAGNHVVLLGWDMSAADIRANQVLGFAVERLRHSDGEKIWIKGLKTFASIDPNPQPGVPVSTYDFPIQSF